MSWVSSTAALPLVLAVEMLLQAINIDLQNIPSKTGSGS